MTDSPPQPLDPAAGTPPERVKFVSRSAPDRDPQAALDAHGSPLPSLADPIVQLLLLGVMLLQGLSWWILEGYQLADSVEYMERAQAFVRSEEVVDSTAIRSFAFPSVLVPFFAFADWIGVEDFKPVVWLVRWIQMLFALLLVRSCIRIGARLGGRSTGLIAGVFAGVNPVFLQYSVSPVSGIASAMFAALAIENALDPPRFRRGVRTGVWMGLAIMMAYQSILIVAPVLLAMMVRDRWKQRASWTGALAGLAIGLVAQAALDKLYYGEWAASLSRHFLSHLYPYLGMIFWEIGFEEFGRKIYYLYEAVEEVEYRPDGVVSDAGRREPLVWYFTHLTRMLVWPVIVCGIAGLGRAVKQANWKTSMLLFVFVVNASVMSIKGAKDFRLWLPLLPAIAPICAHGCGLLFHKKRGRDGKLRASRLAGLAAAGIVVATTVLGIDTLMARNTRRFSGYWEAMRIIDGEAAERRVAADGSLGPKLRVSSAYHWAVYLRESEDVELVKLPHHLDHWTNYDPVERHKTFAALDQLDFFITHLAVLSNPAHRDLMEFVNGHFEVHAMLWDQEVFEHIGPVFVLQRRTGDEGAKTFYEVIEDVDPELYRRERHLPPPVHFVRRLGQHVERITLLGWEFDELLGDDHGWITYHWYCASEIRGNYTVIDRLTTFDERHSWQNNHAPAYGVLPTSKWTPGSVVRESWPVVAASDPYDWKAPFRPMGGPYRRGDLMPANLWIDLATFGAGDPAAGEPEIVITGRMEPAAHGASEPLRRGLLADVLRTPDGATFSKDDLVRVGRLFLPVHDSARLTDDGSPVGN